MIGSTYLSDKELKKEIKRYTDKLRKRIKRIRVLGDKAMQDAVAKFDEYINNRKKITPKTERAELLSYYRQLRYIDSLKSSTVKGALATKNKFEPIRDRLNTLSKTQQEKFWEIYGKLYETNATMEKFKYEIFNESIDEVFGATETDKIVQDIIDEYNETLKDLGSEADTEQIRKKLFTNKIDKMYK